MLWSYHSRTECPANYIPTTHYYRRCRSNEYIRMLIVFDPYEVQATGSHKIYHYYRYGSYYPQEHHVTTCYLAIGFLNILQVKS